MPGNMSKKILAVLLVAALIAAAFALYRPVMQWLRNPSAFCVWLRSLGGWGVAAFVLLNMLQVIVAVIPAGPFEIAAGMAFGVWKACLLCSLSMTLGGVVVVLLVRRFGMRFVTLFVKEEQLASLPFLHNSEKLRPALFLLFLIPGAPKDVLTYAVGLSDIPLRELAVVFLLGRFPSILLTALSGSALGNARYGVVAVIAVVALVLYLAGSRICKNMHR